MRKIRQISCWSIILAILVMAAALSGCRTPQKVRPELTADELEFIEYWHN